jgi:hypothetical protein
MFYVNSLRSIIREHSQRKAFPDDIGARKSGKQA